MKNRLIILLVAFLLLAVAISDVAAGKGEKVLRDFSYTFYGGSDIISLIDDHTPRADEAIELALPGAAELKKLVVYNEMGDIKVRAVSGGGYGVSGNLTVYALTQEDAAAYLSQIDIQLKEQSDSYVLALNQSKARPPEVYALKMDLEILVPANVSLEARTKQGLLEAADLTGNVELDAMFGSIAAMQLTGDLKVKGMHSRIAVRQIDGDVRVETHFNEAEIKDVVGFLQLTTHHTDFNVENVTRGVKLFCRFGNGRVDGVNDDLEYFSEHANLKFAGIAGTITGFSRHGRVSIREPRGNLGLKAEFTSIDLLLKTGSGFRISGEAEFTGINSDFELESDKENHRQTFSYLQGTGNNTYKLDLRHGSLHLIKTGP